MNKKVTTTAAIDTDAEDIATKILHLLSIYPIISPTMLQGALGPQMRPAHWRPVLETLIEDKRVIESQKSMLTPTERYNTYSRLSLPGTNIGD